MTRWLDADQQRSWRAWVAASTLLRERLSRELQAEHGIPLTDYEILVRLSEAEGRAMRMSVLAERTHASRSRLSHQIDRMERAGMVRRQACPNDRRGQLAVLTDQGWDALVAAAPTHVAGVRRHLVDVFTPEEFEALGTACTRVVMALAASEDPSDRTT
jgi:DNA-binding MarR family transcriptional regulator